MTERFFTEPEVAEILRCSTSKVKRLRLGGKLTYIRGRPVLIRQQDLDAYLASVTRGKSLTVSEAADSLEMDIVEQIRKKNAASRDARTWALNQMLKRKWRASQKAGPVNKKAKQEK
ncbi:excisionase family DNA binding protein [Rhizobium sp. PP-F2F-G48]|uniref:helix-turn-helix domain-containing protein n=1 Tax=Rhizobium sp. PP-F2F-G48 TaxID=2135651 RepID=UPI00104603F6|nr:helix-turn-helix domain-containing protein [Rhizobium sp. PP-F2F-G48]TCM54946.1 excisionase family DNA binding protein [Rhizobium sp. PP-F2F-G48]